MSRSSLAISVLFLLTVAAHGQLAESNVRGHIVDGRLVLEGRLKQLAGIEAMSSDGRLSLDAISVGEDTHFLTEPFPNGTVVSNTPNIIVIGVLGEEKRVDLEGLIETSILYDGDIVQARSDLRVDFGVGNDSPAAFPYFFGPEPAGGLQAAVGMVALMGWRTRRR